MNRYLSSLLFGALLVGCGGTAADKLKGDPWTVAKWTYSVDDVFDGAGNQPPSKKTKSASTDNAGRFTFTLDEDALVEKGQFERLLTKFPDGSKDPMTFTDMPNAQPVLVTWDPGGVGSLNDDDHIMIYDGTDATWNGIWEVSGSGDELTLSRSYQTDASSTQHTVAKHTFTLTR